MPPLIEFAPTAVVLSLVVGAGVLWNRTRSPSSCSQFIAAGVLFAGVVFEQIRWLVVLPADQSAFALLMRSETMRIVMASAQWIGVVAFLSSYLWFALTHKRI